MAQRQVLISQLENCFVPIDRRQFLELRHIITARNLLYRIPCLLVRDSDSQLVRNVEAILIAKLFVERKQLLPVDQRFRKADVRQLETQGTVLCVVYSSTILRTVVRLTPVRREIWRRDRC